MVKGTSKVIFLLMLVLMSSLTTVVNVKGAPIEEAAPDSIASPSHQLTFRKECYDKESDVKLGPVNSRVGPPMNTLRTPEVHGVILTETQACNVSSTASYSRHLMSKDCDGTERTTTFLPSDSRACCVMTVTVSSQVRTKWVYRKDDTKGWDVYGEATSDISGTYHVCHYLTIAGNPDLPFYPRGWAVEIYLDGNYIGDEYFEITDNGRQHVTCEDVVDSEPTGIKSTFQIGVDPKVCFYLRLYDVAYFSERTWHCHDYLVKWYKPDGSPYWTWGPDGWSDYKDSNPAYDYWLWVAVWGDITLDANTPTGQWKIEVYIDQYYDGGWEWYHIATTFFTVTRVTEPPVAVLSASPTYVKIHEIVTFDGSSSYDPDGGSIVSYWYDFGDGFDSGWTSQPTYEWEYTDLGDYPAKLKVKDDEGEISSWSSIVYIHVTENHPPVLSDGYIDGEGPWWGYTDTTFQFLIKYTDQDGDAAGTKQVYVYDYGKWWCFDMDHLAGNPTDGEWFTAFLTDFSCGTHNCYFYFTDVHGADPRYPETGYLPFTAVEMGSDLHCLPAGSKRTDPTDPSLDGTKLLTGINLNGGGQTIIVNPGQTVSISCTYQLWAPSNPNELDQLFFIYSWTLSWPPSSAYYHGVYHGTPGLYPGVSDSDSFTLTAPSTEGTYYLYWCSGAHYSIPDAVNEYKQELTTPAHAKIIVQPIGDPDIDVDPMHLDFNFTAPGFTQNIYTGETDCQGCCGNCCCPCDNRTAYPIMQPDSETLQEWMELYNSAPLAHMDSGLIPPTGSYSLLDHLDYIPSERNQGSCGNCWVWGGTGVMEIALDVQEEIKDRLSIQYFTSCWHGGTANDWACCGGWLDWQADWYEDNGFAIPWSNTNAHWQDGGRTCADGTSVPCATISTSPNYPLSNCAVETVATQGVGQAQAITNIKSVLHQNKAIWFAFFLPNSADWSVFYDFWNNEPESAIWSPDYSCGHSWVDGEGGGHAVLCVGYDDTDPNNSYWIMVNSWGTAGGGRPNGIFHIDMDMNYDCYYDYHGTNYYSFYWQTLDITFELGCQPVTIYNYGNADLEVASIQCDQPWLSVSPPCPPSFIVPPGESQTVSVCVDPTGLDVGVYYGNVRIYSNDPDENPVTVTVTLYVERIQCTVTFYTDPSTIGSVTFAGKTYTNGQSDNFDCGTTGPATANAPECWEFDHWEATDNVYVKDSYANPTTITINCGGTLKAFFKPTPCSVTFYTDPSEGSSITFDGATYTNGQSDVFNCGTYTAIANPPECCEFDHWESGENVFVTDPNANPTSVEVKCGGWLKAVFRLISCEVIFYTEPADPGFNITFKSKTYTNSQSDMFDCGTSGPATANAPDCWVFDHWDVSGNVSVSDIKANPTTVTIKCGGDLKAVFKRIECQVTFYTDPDNGTITFNGKTYANNQTDMFYCGTFNPATANPPGGWDFSRWEVGGNVYVDNDTANPTNVTIKCGGFLRAVFFKPFVKCDVYFFTDPSDVGSITFEGQTYTNGQYQSFKNGTSGFATANTDECWEFDYWKTDGNASVSDNKANPTTFTVSCGGNLTAVFKRIECDVTFYTDPPNGSITFKGKTYTNGDSGRFLCGTEGQATANPPGDWNFIHWIVSGKVYVSDNTTNPANVTIKCGGNITAVFKHRPTLLLDPSEIVGQNVGENFTLTLRLDMISDLVMWAVDIEWDPSKLELQGLPVEGACLKSAGKPTAFLWASIVPGKITDLTCAILGFVPGGGVNVPPCPDDLANFTFKVLNYTCYVGTWINITFSQLDDSYLNEIEHTTANAKLTLCPCDLFATIQMPCYPEPMLYANVTEYPIKITIFNNGSADAGPFNTCFSACLKGDCFFNKTRIPGVEAGKNVTVLIHFMPKHKGMYNVTVTVDCDYEVAESNENNNKLTLNVEVRIGGDINGDDTVDHKDLLLLASAYGCKRGDTFYIPEADFDCDGKVDHKDLLILASNYGKIDC